MQISGEGFQAGFQVVPDKRNRGFLKKRTFPVIRIGKAAQMYSRLVLFIVSFHKLYEAGRFSDTQNEQTGCERVERSGMADPLYARLFPNCVNNVMGCLAALLVDQ